MQLLSIFSKETIGWGAATIVLGVIAVLAICYAKSPKGTATFLKIVGCVILFGVLPCCAAYCGVYVNGYYSAEGGIFGQIKKSLNINTGKTSTDTFEVSELNLRLDENNEYSATIKVDLKDEETVLKIDKKKKYTLLVNGGLTSDNLMSTTGNTIALGADYTYSFKDFQKAEVLKDTLHIAFVMNEENIICRLSSEGDANARDMWGLYYKKNGMKIKFVEDDYKKTPIVSEGEGETPNFHSLKFVDGEVVVTKIYVEGTTFTDVPTPNIAYGQVFEGWSTDGESVFDFSDEISEDMTFTPIFSMAETRKVVYELSRKAQDYPTDPPLSGEVITQEANFSASLKSEDYPKQFINARIRLYEVSIFARNEGGMGTTQYYLQSDLSLSEDIPYCFIWLSLGESIEIATTNGNTLVLTLESLEINGGYSAKITITNASKDGSYIPVIHMDSVIEFEIVA